jgi:hypothetical protein
MRPRVTVVLGMLVRLFGRMRWQPSVVGTATRSRRPAGALFGVAVLLAACGSPDSDEAAGSSEFDDLSCEQVDAELDEVRAVLAETFGGGPEGREAHQTLINAIEAQPDCFSQDEIEMAVQLRDMLPASEVEQAAIEEAEDACDEDDRGYTGSGTPDRSSHETAQDVLEDPQEQQLPAGEPEEAAGDDDWIAFDFHDDGDFTGRVMVEQHDDGGWFLRRIVSCGRNGLLAE